MDTTTATRGRRALTKRTADAARYQGNGRSHCIVWCGELRGFGLRVMPTGRKSWVLAYRTQAGTKRLVTLGPYPGLTPDEARRDARALIVAVARGADPAATRRRAREAASFRELAQAYLDEYARGMGKNTRDAEHYVNKVLVPAFGTKKAEAVARADVATLHRRIGRSAPYAANRCIAVLSRIYTWAESAGRLPAGHPSPTRGVARFPEEKRARFVSHDEMPRLAAAIRAEPNVYIRAAMLLYLLTGFRKSELLRARWEDVDLERGVWTLPTTKAGREHRLPLAPPAVRILRELPREAGNPFVFCGSRAGSHIMKIDGAWNRIRTAAQVEDVRLHDLRRTVGSWLAQGGASLPLIGNVLNHTTPSATAIYARFSDQSARRALEDHAEAVLAASARPVQVPGTVQ
jgi:integrase